MWEVGVGRAGENNGGGMGITVIEQQYYAFGIILHWKRF